MTTKVIYENEYYEVHLLPDRKKPYGLFNREHGVYEAFEPNKPQILVYAEQFNHMLKTEFHKTLITADEADFDFSGVPTTGAH